MVRTIAELFYEALRYELPDALARKVDGQYQPVSHREVQALVERLALALNAHGLQAGERVAILSENRPEWAVMDYACAVSGLVSVPIYPTLNGEQTAMILRHSGARWVLCSSAEQLLKVQEQWAGLPELEVALLMDGGIPAPGGTVLRWSALLEQGENLRRAGNPVRNWAAARRPADLLTLIYTSGTTGDPKGVMLTHGNLVANITTSLRHLTPVREDRCLSMLPLSHIFERMAGHYLMFHCGASIYYAESLQTLAQDLQEVAPTVMLTVPRIFEKIYARVRDAVSEGNLAKRLLFRWATGVSRRRLPRLLAGQQPGPWLRLLGLITDRLIYARIRARTGGRLRFAVSGGAALNPRILEFFWALGVPVYEGYGLTETSPVLTLNRQGQVRPGYVGQPILDTWEGLPFLKLSDEGELLCRGPNVMAGYWRDEAATREVIDAEGYFHTGDIGELDEAGRIRITDRKKEILVTSGGKNVAPQPIENLLRADKYISQAVLIGDGRNYITALIVPHFPVLRRWADYKELPFSDDASLATLPEAVDKIARRVERINEQLSNYERIRKVTLLDRELTAEEGLLTPSLKIKRRAVTSAFAPLIEAMYGDATELPESRILPFQIPKCGGARVSEEHRKAS